MAKPLMADRDRNPDRSRSNQFEASTVLPPSKPLGICATGGGKFEPRLGEVANLNQPNILVLVLIVVEFQGKESAFLSKWLRRNVHIVE